VRVARDINLEGKRGRGRPEKREVYRQNRG